MKSVIYIFILFIALSSISFAASPNNSFTNQFQNGRWILSKPSGWVVISPDGAILPISSTTKVFGCGNNPISLTDNLDGISVKIIITHSKVPNGIPNIKSLNIICD